MKNIGDELKTQRIISKKSLRQVEKDTGISIASLSRWENGIVSPSIEFCIKLADYYGITLDELVGRE